MNSMALHFDLRDNVLFSSWMISGAGGYFGTIVFTISLAILRVVVSNHVFKLQAKIERNRNPSEKKVQPAVDLSRFQIYMERLPLAAAGAFEVFLGLVLMLIVMTFNASLLFAAAVGSLIGFVFFDKKDLAQNC
ncbi:hypothetical protein EDD21DRAFT_362394 [Dissophora ornata]|nr:hypothetical protein EDD21DRAFT_362394 [Dissophora ornata]